MARPRSTATPLALAWAALIVYASLYPGTGWRVPAADWGWLQLPWPSWFPVFDIVANLLGYLPLGALVYVVMVRGGAGRGAALVAATLAGASLSYALEVLQQFLPARVPSLLDLTLNAAGALLGALTAMALHGLGLLARWQAWRERWFAPASAGALLLLVSWPLGLLFPAPVPLGLGQGWDDAARWLLAQFDGTPWAGDAQALLTPIARSTQPLNRMAESVAVALGVLAPCLVALSAARRGWHRVVLVGGAAALAVGTMTLSTALNFGPDNALAWWTPASGAGLIAGVLLALACCALPQRLLAGLGLVVLTALVTLVATAPTDPYYAQSLQAWQQGRFVRFHGVAQWVGWLWPYAAVAWLLSRLGGDGGRRTRSLQS
jgi:VanZ family protein